MDKQEALENEYRSQRKVYEEQEDELLKQRDKAVSVIDEVQARSHYYLKDIVPDTDMLLPGVRKIERMKEEIVESTRMSLKELSRKREKVDENYYSELQKLTED